MRHTRSFHIGSLPIGGGAPVTVQSMTNTDSRDAAATIQQIRDLAAAGCDIVRLSVYDEACLDALPAIIDASPVPLVADIHYRHDLAIGAMERGDMYASTGPEIKELYVEDGIVHVECSPAEQVILYLGGKSQRVEKVHPGETLTCADLPLPDDAPYFRVAVFDRYANAASTRGFFADEYKK